MQLILQDFGLTDANIQIQRFGNGLINHTWKVTTNQQEYILQRVNDAVFKQPEAIASNINMIASYLNKHYPDYHFVAPISSNDSKEMIYRPDKGYYRVFPFVPGSHSISVVENAEQAFQAAKQFGRFTSYLSRFDVSLLNVTIPRFHDLNFRYQQFIAANLNGNKARIKQSSTEISLIQKFSDIVSEFNRIQPLLKTRVTHHDTKISNILFDENDQGLCVIDLDTVMPGYFISDVGDMMRTYLSPVSEEESDFGKIEIRDDFYHSIERGYLSEMKDELTQLEIDCFFYAGKFMIYSQALRFLTDHLNNDVYYGASYPDHNFVRAKNQLTLLERFVEKQSLLSPRRLKTVA
jgi:Ser/Thr protein kinase RdoA (MazF antagonist)